MRRAHPAVTAPSLLGLLLCSGCFGPYQSPYGGYSNPYGGYPAQGAPVQTLQPGGTYTPGGQFGQPSPYMQPTPSGQPTPYGGTYAPQDTLGLPSSIDQTGGDAPFYGSGTSGAPRPSYDGGVPTPHDAGEIQFQQPIQPDNTAIDSYGAVDPASAETAGVAKVDLETAHFLEPVREAALAAEGAEAVGSTFAETSPTVDALPSTPFAYDANYEWLRGVLRFDEASGRWAMVYSDNPADDDLYGGQLEVADSPELAQFKPQSVVLLRGGVDKTGEATTGQPVFRATAVEPVVLSVP